MTRLDQPSEETLRAADEAQRWNQANQTYLAASLHWLRLRLQRMAATPQAGERANARWFARPAPASESAAAAIPSAAEEAEAAAARVRAAQCDPAPALPLLGERLGLAPFETDVLLLCVAMELDPALPGLIAAVQGTPHPSFALALRLFEQPSWDALAAQRPLRYLRLIEINQPGATPLTAAALRADERVVGYAKGLNLLDARLDGLVRDCPAPPPIAPSQQAQAERIVSALQAHGAERRDERTDPGPLPLLQLLGGDPGSRLAIAAHACAQIGCRLYVLPAQSLPSARSELETLARLWYRESLLLPVALYLEADDVDIDAGEAAAALRTLLAQPLGLAFVGLPASPLQLQVPQWTLEAPMPSAAEQHAAWSQALPDGLAERERRAEALSGHFRLNLQQIHDVAAGLRLRGGDAWEVCRDLSLARLDTLAQRLEPKSSWDDLVLGDEALGLLRQIVGQVHERHRVYQQWGYAERMNRGLGLSALFAGESGTGKTLAAEVIARELRLHLYRIDLSSVVSKYIGETEKNLRRVFDAAEQGGAILFFDEADALFGKRSEVKDSHDRYANIEINYLLQRMEAFSGLAILATNMKSALDGAFLRRLRFVVNFQFPGPAERARIWRNALAPGVPREALDYERLARFGLSGGNIHSIALNAAFAAAQTGTAVSMPLLLTCLRTELRKLGKPVNESEFAPVGTRRAG
ncbi:ATP-binding protein [Lysobacter sp. BMK333-48F3]|uniref:ATP-binding protein n=1 Tax=Lysobacter sp. BMK333-48F3 TaxID=2867962 RepID=UPI001C8C6A79|nr:ATP-binding protein [Lysobacter sp. BMK333-48F3]MBX9403074.1 ATP-binding protein [Lysobacter sp. BMK333-48F3]